MNRDLRKCAGMGCSRACDFHMGDHGGESDGNDSERPQEHLVLLFMGHRQHRMAGVRPVVGTVQSCGAGCRPAGVRHVGHCCLGRQEIHPSKLIGNLGSGT